MLACGYLSRFTQIVCGYLSRFTQMIQLKYPPGIIFKIDDVKFCYSKSSHSKSSHKKLKYSNKICRHKNIEQIPSELLRTNLF